MIADLTLAGLLEDGKTRALIDATIAGVVRELASLPDSTDPRKGKVSIGIDLTREAGGPKIAIVVRAVGRVAPPPSLPVQRRAGRIVEADDEGLVRVVYAPEVAEEDDAERQAALAFVRGGAS
jgi:hypothetical protein